MTNCPNCAAPIRSLKCEFCGTEVINFSDVTPGKIAYIKINDNVFAGCTSLSYVDFNGNTADWVVNETITITADQLYDPYDAALVVKQYAQYQWLR